MGVTVLEMIWVLFSLYSFLLGICVASFINVVIWRVPQGISIAKGRSFCPHCHHELKWVDLFPVVSYLFLKGRCRYCGAKIPMRDTILEFLGGIAGVVCFMMYPFQWDAIFVFSLFMILLAITMIDFDTMTIPNGLLIALLVPIVFMCLLHPEISWFERILGFFCVSVPMYVLILIIPDCFGGGDVKLIAICGVLLGWKMTLLAAFIAILMGGIYAVYLMATKKSKKGAYIAFGPYLSVGIMVSLTYGESILNWYLSLFGLH